MAVIPIPHFAGEESLKKSHYRKVGWVVSSIPHFAGERFLSRPDASKGISAIIFKF